MASKNLPSTKGVTRNVLRRIKKDVNRRTKSRAQSMVNFLGRGESRFSAILNQVRKVSNASSRSQQDKLNEQGKKVAMFLQSKFRGIKAKKELNRLKTKKEQDNIAAAKEKISRLKNQHGMALENFNGQTRRVKRPVRPAPVLNLGSQLKSQLNNMTQSIQKLLKPTPNYKPPLPPRKKLDNSLNNMNRSVRRLVSTRRGMNKPIREKLRGISQKFKPKLSPIPEMVSKAKSLLTRAKSHWILNGPKTTHRKATVKRITKLAPK